MSHYIHHVPGRLRIKSAHLKQTECHTLNTLLSELSGIESFRHNAKAGSVLVHYDPKSLNADDILYHLYKAGCLESGVSTTLGRSPQSSTLVKQVGTVFGNALFGTLLRKSVETSVLSLARGLR